MFTIDRFEEDYAVIELENGKIINIPKILVENFNEGDIIDLIINKEAMNKRQNEIEDLMDELFQ